MKKGYKHIACIISGFLTALAFIVPSFAFLPWFSLIPFAYVLLYEARSGKEAAFDGFLFGISFYLPLISWIFSLYPLENLGLSPFACAALLTLAWAVISLIMAAETALFALVLKKIKVFAPFSFAALWILMEFLQEKGEFGFTWGRIALTQYQYTSIIQSASLFGSLFISFVIVLTNALLAMAIKNRKKLPAFLAAGVFGFNILLGAAAPCTEVYKTFTASLVWEDIMPLAKGSGEQTSETYRLLMDESAKQEGEVVLWTETAVPVILRENSAFLKEYKKLAREKGFTLMAGGFTRDSGKLYSSVVAISDEGNVLGSIHKRHLVPFGEYIPFRNLIKVFVPKISEYSPESEEISPFDKSCIVDTKVGRIGGIICYDSTFPQLAREVVKEGAEVLTLSTNDAWFYGSHASENHLSQSVFRAVENGRYILRSANLGESCIIDNRGKILVAEEVGEHSLTGEAGLIKETTLYTKIGDVFVFAVIFTLLILLILSYKNKGAIAK